VSDDQKTMWTLSLTNALRVRLLSWRRATVLRPGDPALAAVAGLYRALAGLLPATVRTLASPVLDALDERAERTSVTLATPLDPVIVLSPAAVADPITEAVTLAHEWCHVRQIADGRVASVVDYASGELRARAEADATACALWLRYVLTGDLPTDAPTLGDLYHLDAGDAALARGVIASHLATIRAGLVPPLDVCVCLAQWLSATPYEMPAAIRGRIPHTLPETR
jgi:hypothetical protein